MICLLWTKRLQWSENVCRFLRRIRHTRFVHNKISILHEYLITKNEWYLESREVNLTIHNIDIKIRWAVQKLWRKMLQLRPVYRAQCESSTQLCNISNVSNPQCKSSIFRQCNAQRDASCNILHAILCMRFIALLHAVLREIYSNAMGFFALSSCVESLHWVR